MLLRAADDFKKIAKLDPFKGVRSGKRFKCYVTFFLGELEHSMELPFVSSKKDFKILKQDKYEVYSVSFVCPDGSSGNSVSYIEKEFKTVATTRNWNTVLALEKILFKET